ncbi:MAG: hypothetical protein ACUVR2_11290 [Anaerolineae bacterium]
MTVSRWTDLAFQQAATWGTEAPVALYHLVVPRSTAEVLGPVHLNAVPDEEVTLSVADASRERLFEGYGKCETIPS